MSRGITTTAPAGGPDPPDHTSAPVSATLRPDEVFSRGDLPLAIIDRFESIQFLGQGGMGTVYRAKDRRLAREVAIKLIHGGGPDADRRFLLEARAQARIEHEHICKVYEVGSAEGRRFIIMQLIDGEPLDEIKNKMTVEQRVKVIKEVASALHEAHRTGLIHRDMKPSNIMVERDDDGVWKPYVMDFGLAREAEARGPTMTGAIAGTPAFMAPEQARGEIRALDRRTDIYSLGATLYDLLAGHPPFVESDVWQLLRRVGQDEAPPIRQVNREVPEDLETIVMKCLEREPHRRYESARALAEDLGRYLDGEPVQARRASFGYVLVKRVIKHKIAVALSIASLAAAIVLTFIWIRSGRIATQQAELSQQLGQDVKEMELLLRWAYGLPLHDMRREKAHVRERMKEIEQRIERMGELGAGPGHYALGRGYLALREPEPAREHLEKALLSGYGGREVESALGRALGDLYKKELEETHRIGDKQTRDERRRVLEKELLEPALVHLRNGEGDALESEVYIEGLIAFYNKKYDEALEKARLSEERALSTYEAKKLRADVYSALGTEEKERGQTEQALLDYERAAESYESARTIARSDAAVYEAECELWGQRIELESSLGKSPARSFEQARSACDGALLINPESGAAHGKKAWALWRFGSHLLITLQDPTQILRQAIAAGEVAARLEPSNANVLDTLGNAYSDLGAYEMVQGKDPRASLRLAAESLAKAIELHPNFAWAYNDLGGVYRSIADYELSRGIDPTGSLIKSIAYREKAIELNPAYHYPYTNMAIAYELRAQYELRNGKDPSESIRLAIGACDRSLQVNKSYYGTYDTLGNAYLMEAQYKSYRGDAYDDSIKKALQWFESELGINSSSYYAHLGIATTHLFVAHDLVSQGKDVGASLKKAESALREMEKTGGEEVQVPLARTKILLLKARAQVAGTKEKEGDGAASLEAIEAAFSPALKAGAGSWEVFATGAELAFWTARAARASKGLASSWIRKGIAWADEGLAISPAEPALLAWKGALLLLFSRVEDGPPAEDMARQGRSLVDDAMQKNPFLRHEWMVTEAALSAE